MLDVTTWISRLMLDNIGEGNHTSQCTHYFVTKSLFYFFKAAFEHQFNAVEGGGVGELSEAFTNLL